MNFIRHITSPQCLLSISIIVIGSMTLAGCDPMKDSYSDEIISKRLTEIERKATGWSDSVSREGPETLQIVVDGSFYVISNIEFSIRESGIKVDNEAEIDPSRYFMFPAQRWFETIEEVIGEIRLMETSQRTRQERQ